MTAEEMRYRIEENARAICLAFAVLCFGIGLLLQRSGRSWDRGVTLPEVPR